ncbi:nucleotide sugar dehydrogenase [Streptomyces sp. NPDC056160]|uniref:nucleotide sugar dehydrogenase n=1 Tax=Streptomyces sp. NPDC056160 TaxID=3345731 RepID=UPI0035D5713F
MTITAIPSETGAPSAPAALDRRPPPLPVPRLSVAPRWLERLAGTPGGAPLSGMSVAVVGLGYVGLPLALGLWEAGARIIGVDRSAERLAAVRAGRVDVLPGRHAVLACAARDDGFVLTARPDALREADAVLICVPTPVTAERAPDLRPLRRACADVVDRAREGQLIVLTSTSYAGTTRDLLIEPLRARGLVPEDQVLVAFAPERIDPGNVRHAPEATPRVIGAAGPLSARAAAALLAPTAARIHQAPCPEAAEMAKLWENTFRAVNIALANELSDACVGLGLSPVDVLDAAATKPYGFMPFRPGPGAGGHCIPCDPHYLLAQLPGGADDAPLIGSAMSALHERPAGVARTALRMLRAAGLAPQRARVLVLGAAYKPGVSDVRESPALRILALLAAEGVQVSYSDPCVPALTLADGSVLRSEAAPRDRHWDLVIVHTVQPGTDLAWLDEGHRVLDPGFHRAADPVVGVAR